MTTNILNGGQIIVDYLVREKVPYVFGLCGHGNIGLLDALFERSGDIKTISTHHETTAGFMADVYYRVAGKPVATFTSCGPGSVPIMRTHLSTRSCCPACPSAESCRPTLQGC